VHREEAEAEERGEGEGGKEGGDGGGGEEGCTFSDYYY